MASLLGTAARREIVDECKSLLWVRSMRPRADHKQRSDTHGPPTRPGRELPFGILRRIRYPTVSINRQARHEIVSIQNASAQMGSKDSISRQGMVYETEKFF